MLDLRLINAEILKLRRRRGMLAIALLCTVGFATIAFIVTAIQHAGDPTKYAPAGGLKAYRDVLGGLEMLVLIMGTIVGATAGTQDIESGVFRERKLVHVREPACTGGERGGPRLEHL